MKKQTYDLEERLLAYTEIAIECSVLSVCFFYSMLDVRLFYVLFRVFVMGFE
jgi:hypothetical protein